MIKEIFSKVKDYFMCLFGKEYLSAHCLKCGKLYAEEIDRDIANKLRRRLSMQEEDSRCSCYDEKITDEKLDRIVDMIKKENKISRGILTMVDVGSEDEVIKFMCIMCRCITYSKFSVIRDKGCFCSLCMKKHVESDEKIAEEDEKFDKVIDKVKEKIKESDIIYTGDNSDFMMEKLVVTMRDDKVDVNYEFQEVEGDGVSFVSLEHPIIGPPVPEELEVEHEFSEDSLETVEIEVNEENIEGGGPSAMPVGFDYNSYVNSFNSSDDEEWKYISEFFIGQLYRFEKLLNDSTYDYEELVHDEYGNTRKAEQRLGQELRKNYKVRFMEISNKVMNLFEREMGRSSMTKFGLDAEHNLLIERVRENDKCNND